MTVNEKTDEMINGLTERMLILCSAETTRRERCNMKRQRPMFRLPFFPPSDIGNNQWRPQGRNRRKYAVMM
jgi:hypothetical protein